MVVHGVHPHTLHTLTHHTLTHSQVIRELREEVEKLKQMLGLGGVGGGGGGGEAPSSRELADLQEKLRISESLMQEMTMTWEQKVQATEKIHQVQHRNLDMWLVQRGPNTLASHLTC